MQFKKRAQSGAKVNNQFGSRVFLNKNIDVNANGNMSSHVDYVFEQRNRDPRLYLSVSVMGIEIHALFDSGASHSVLGRKGLWIADKFPHLIQNFNGSVETADSKKHMVRCVIKLPISLEERTKELAVLIVPTLDQTLILGMDFWKVMEFVPDVKNCTWEFPSVTHYVNEIHTVGLLDGENLTEEQKIKLQDIVKTYFEKNGRQARKDQFSRTCHRHRGFTTNKATLLSAISSSPEASK